MNAKLKQTMQELNEILEQRLKCMKLLNEAEATDDEEAIAEYYEKYKELSNKAKELHARYEELMDKLYGTPCKAKMDRDIGTDM